MSAPSSQAEWTDRPPSAADIVVIGGGVIGCSIAYHLAQAGLKPVVIEKDRPAAGSSGACDGFVFLQSKRPGIHLDLALESVAMFETLADELDFDIEFDQTGGYIVIETEAEGRIMDHLAEEQQGSGLEVEFLDDDELRRREPALAPGLYGGTLCRREGMINPIRLTLGLAHGAARLGAKLTAGVEATGLEITGGRLEAVLTNQGRVACPRAVIAAGVWSPPLGAAIGLDLPIKPRRGQLLVTEPLPRLLKRGMLSAKYLVAKHDPKMAEAAGQGVALEQTLSGNILIGSTREFVGFDRRTTPDGLARIAANAARIVPSLNHINIIRAFAGLRPYTPDGLPILGPAPGLEGVFLAAGHEGDGIALSPITGRLMAESILGNGRAELIDRFRLERFTSGDRTDG